MKTGVKDNSKKYSITAHTEVCGFCDSIVQVDKLSEGELAKCPRCGHVLVKLPKNPVQSVFVFALTSLMLLVFISILPFMSISAKGMTMSMTVYDTVSVMFAEDYDLLAVVILFFIIVAPTICLSLILIIYGSILFKLKNYKFLKSCTKFFYNIHHWSMVDVFMIALMVSLIKMLSYAEISLHSGFICFIAFVICYIKTFASVDRNWLWSIFIGESSWVRYEPKDSESLDKIALDNNLTQCHCCGRPVSLDDDKCPFCAKKISSRKNQSIQRCLAFLFTAILFYFPANFCPIMTTEVMGTQFSSTIIGGVISLWNMGSEPIAMIIFIASIMIPVFKIVVLLYLCYAISHKNEHNLLTKSKLYALTEFIGKWSMIDVFVVAVLSALLRMKNIMAIYPSVASVSFCAVVIFTIFAANCLDPRLIWNPTKRENSSKKLKVNK